MAPVRRRNLVICAVTFVFAAAACSLDFTARPPEGDAGSPPDASPDVTPDAPAFDAGDGATPDVDAAVDCDTLIADVGATKTAARVCTLGQGQCQTTIKDQCDCDVVIAQAGATATADYEAAVARLKNSSCAKGCTSCMTVSGSNCLSQTDGIHCYP